MSANVEALLKEALTPVEPPTRLFEDLEDKLNTLAQVAQEELDSWELAAMRDPRNWARPVLAAAIAGGAGAGLVALRVRSRHNDRVEESSNLLDLAERTLQDIAQEARRVIPERQDRSGR